jgi:hypothetical protein
VVFCENGMSVKDVMVGGRWIVRDAKLLTVDEPVLYRRARQLREDMDERLRRQYADTAALEPALREVYLRSANTPWSP